MNKLISSMEYPSRGYWLNDGPTRLISDNQKQRLTALIYQNYLDPHERELRLLESSEMTEADYFEALYNLTNGNYS